MYKIVTACALCELCSQFDLGNFMLPEMYAHVSLAIDVLEMLFR